MKGVCVMCCLLMDDIRLGGVESGSLDLLGFSGTDAKRTLEEGECVPWYSTVNDRKGTLIKLVE